MQYISTIAFDLLFVTQNLSPSFYLYLTKAQADYEKRLLHFNRCVIIVRLCVRHEKRDKKTGDHLLFLIFNLHAHEKKTFLRGLIHKEVFQALESTISRKVWPSLRCTLCDAL